MIARVKRALQAAVNRQFALANRISDADTTAILASSSEMMIAVDVLFTAARSMLTSARATLRAGRMLARVTVDFHRRCWIARRDAIRDEPLVEEARRAVR